MPRAKAAPEAASKQRQLVAQMDLTYKLKALRALHITAYNMVEPIEKVSVEFFYALGEILEGQRVDELNLKIISKDEFLKEFADS